MVFLDRALTKIVGQYGDGGNRNKAAVSMPIPHTAKSLDQQRATKSVDGKDLKATTLRSSHIGIQSVNTKEQLQKKFEIRLDLSVESLEIWLWPLTETKNLKSVTNAAAVSSAIAPRDGNGLMRKFSKDSLGLTERSSEVENLYSENQSKSSSSFASDFHVRDIRLSTSSMTPTANVFPGGKASLPILKALVSSKDVGALFILWACIYCHL